MHKYHRCSPGWIVKTSSCPQRATADRDRENWSGTYARCCTENIASPPFHTSLHFSASVFVYPWHIHAHRQAVIVWTKNFHRCGHELLRQPPSHPNQARPTRREFAIVFLLSARHSLCASSPLNRFSSLTRGVLRQLANQAAQRLPMLLCPGKPIEAYNVAGNFSSS